MFSRLNNGTDLHLLSAPLCRSPTVLDLFTFITGRRLCFIRIHCARGRCRCRRRRRLVFAATIFKLSPHNPLDQKSASISIPFIPHGQDVGRGRTRRRLCRIAAARHQRKRKPKAQRQSCRMDHFLPCLLLLNVSSLPFLLPCICAYHRPSFLFLAGCPSTS